MYFIGMTLIPVPRTGYQNGIDPSLFAIEIASICVHLEVGIGLGKVLAYVKNLSFVGLYPPGTNLKD